MDCARTRQLAQAYVDRELDITSTLALEEHLAACGDCRAHHEALHRLCEAVSSSIGFEAAPAGLRQRIAQQLGTSAAGERPRAPALFFVPAALLLMLATVLAVLAVQHFAAGEQKIVYHINESTNPATALRNLANHLDSAPDLRAVVVAHNKGVDFLLAGARDAENGELFEARIAKLQARGVEFRVCGNTLAMRAIDPQRIVPQARLVPSGIAEIARLQTKERYAYLRL